MIFYFLMTQTLIFLFLRTLAEGDILIWEVRVSYKRGVQDSEGESTQAGLHMLGFERVKEVRTAKLYRIKGDYSREDIEEMCRRLLANPVSQDYSIREVRENE